MKNVSKDTKLPESIFIVIDDKGRVLKDSARVDFHSCRNNFVMGWMPTIKNHINNYVCWLLWECFECAGYRIEEIELKKDDSQTIP